MKVKHVLVLNLSEEEALALYNLIGAGSDSEYKKKGLLSKQIEFIRGVFLRILDNFCQNGSQL